MKDREGDETITVNIKENLPSELKRLIGDATWQQSQVGHSGTDVYKLTKLADAESAYLKIAKDNNDQESLRRDVEVLHWLEGKLPVPQVYAYFEDIDNGYLLMSEIKGQHGATQELLENPELLVRCYADGLRDIHSIAIENCPFNQSVEVKVELANKRVQLGLVDEGDFEEEYKGFSVEKLFTQLKKTRPTTEDIVFTHGDYCLPNLIIQENEVSGFIDLGRAGLADRYQDIALAVRSLKHNNLGQWVDSFLDCYGLQSIDQEKVKFYILLDEFF
ncbi:APH(3') family aminoglycoside O-phosphotransferase [Bacillus horti]|uniref:Aminoglycoside phosphotransferase n=1 Tax=Caldalkalibacillus horti TaxID=77523 RepID=A0ABT9VXD3_9BACI|nr:APH(3') family aminoglycoside O-phosphotransferase [Bacillus horti]MDQ0165270.1 aminoglycoside phosphotransferase [Bacillus horti]